MTYVLLAPPEISKVTLTVDPTVKISSPVVLSFNVMYIEPSLPAPMVGARTLKPGSAL